MIFHYPYPDRLALIPKPDLDSVKGNIIIYGTEITGDVTAHALEQRGLEFIAFADSDKRKHGQKYLGHNIISPKELIDCHLNAIVLIASSSFRLILSTLVDLGLMMNQIYPCSHIIENVDLAGCILPFSEELLIRSINRYNSGIFFFFNTSNYKIISELFIMPTTKCSLRCKECLFGIPNWNNRKNYDISQIISLVNKLIDLNYQIDTVSIIGGEPLLFHGLSTLVDELCNLSKVDHVTIVTNGTLSINEKLLTVLIKNKNKTIVRISNYGKVSYKVNEIEKILNENQVRYEDTKLDKWYKVPKIKNLKLSDNEVKMKYSQCICCTKDTGRIYTLGERYYPCWFSMVVENRGFLLPENDFVYLYDYDLAVGINKLFTREKFLEACRYCMKSSKEMKISVPVAEQLL